MTEKLDGRVKARTVADGSKQHLWKTKEETASPTVSLPSILLTCTIEAHENREVAVIDLQMPSLRLTTLESGGS